MNAATLSICVDDYPHTMALHRGETASVTLNLAMQVVKPISKAFAPMVREGRFDISEMAIATFLMAKAAGRDLVLLPLVVAERFQETAMFCRAGKGINSPADLAGKKLGAPVFDAGRRAFPIFAKANDVQNVAWTAMDPPLRETMLVRGDVDAITGFTFTSLLNIEARGVKAEDVVVMQYPDFGVKLYGNAIIASPKILKENPAAVKAFLAAFTKGAKDVIADPAKAIESVKARDGIINVALETRRLQLAIDTVINSPSARAEGFGQINAPRMTLMASQVSDAFNTKTRVKSEDIWNGSFLPTAKELDILPKGKK
jgi:NitT/TauT family transport system substrate-binding protein